MDEDAGAGDAYPPPPHCPGSQQRCDSSVRDPPLRDPYTLPWTRDVLARAPGNQAPLAFSLARRVPAFRAALPLLAAREWSALRPPRYDAGERGLPEHSAERKAAHAARMMGHWAALVPNEGALAEGALAEKKEALERTEGQLARKEGQLAWSEATLAIAVNAAVAASPARAPKRNSGGATRAAAVRGRQAAKRRSLLPRPSASPDGGTASPASRRDESDDESGDGDRA
eukprot:gene2523-5811_t